METILGMEKLLVASGSRADIEQVINAALSAAEASHRVTWYGDHVIILRSSEADVPYFERQLADAKVFAIEEKNQALGYARTMWERS